METSQEQKSQKTRSSEKVAPKPHHGERGSKGYVYNDTSPSILGDSLPVVPEKLVKKISNEDFVVMADLVKKNQEA